MKKKTPGDNTHAVPKAMQVQLARLFGSDSKAGSAKIRTATEWKKTLKSVLHEIHRYIAANVDTDELHRLMLLSGLAAADESLKEENFWPGYVEGITRLALTLIGDYPDHRKRSAGGRKKDEHYKLDKLRSGHWTQTPDQRLKTLLAAGAAGFPQLSMPPREALDEFRRQHGFGPGYREFLDWYRTAYPHDYAAIFR